ncbi:hypothetical protein FOZ63_003124, partial [Perkinsus olseni]
AAHVHPADFVSGPPALAHAGSHVLPANFGIGSPDVDHVGAARFHPTDFIPAPPGVAHAGAPVLPANFGIGSPSFSQACAPLAAPLGAFSANAEYNSASVPSAVRKFLHDARKEAREEIAATKFPLFGGTGQSAASRDGAMVGDSHATVRGHLAAYDRLLRQAGIAVGSPTSYFVLFYSLSETVCNRIECEEPLDAVLLNVPLDQVLRHYHNLYQRLRRKLLQCYSDVTEVAELRKRWNELRMRPGQSYIAYSNVIDQLRLELHMIGTAPDEAEVWDKLTHYASTPYGDMALCYKLAGTPLATARSCLMSRASLAGISGYSGEVSGSSLPLSSISTGPTSATSQGAWDHQPASGNRVPNLRLLGPDVCRRCFERGHLAQLCDSASPALIESRCLSCGKGGHKASECRLAKSRPLTCSRCLSSGHLSYACRGQRKSLPMAPGSRQTEGTIAMSSSDVSAKSSDPAKASEASKESPLFVLQSESGGPDDAALPVPSASCGSEGVSWLAAVSCPTPLHGLDHDGDTPQDPLKVDLDLAPFDKPGALSAAARVATMLDTGAARSFISAKLRSSLDPSFIGERRSICVAAVLANGQLMSCTEAVLLRIRAPSGSVSVVWCLVAPHLSCHLILGIGALRSLKLLVHLGPDGILLKSGVSSSTVRKVTEGCSSRDVGVQADEVQVCHVTTKPAPPTSPALMDSNALSFDEDLFYEIWGRPPRNEFIADTQLCSILSPSATGDLPHGVNPLFRGLTPSEHLYKDGVSRMCLRYTYGVPWLSNVRMPRPTPKVLQRHFARDAVLVKRLKSQDMYDQYAAVFAKYRDTGAIRVVSPSEYSSVLSVIPHFPVLSPGAVSTKVRPVLNGVLYRGIIGSGRDIPASKKKYLNGTLPSLLTFRGFPTVAALDLTMAFYQLMNDDTARYLFCVVFDAVVYRLRGPPMGAPHAPFCLEDAMRRLRALAEHKLPQDVRKQLEDAIAHKKPPPLHYEPYMDDIVCGASTMELLLVVIDAFLRAADCRGFSVQPAKQQIGAPASGHKAVLGCDWFPDDTIGPQAPPSDALPLLSILPEKWSVDTGFDRRPTCSTTRRDLLSFVNSHYDPLGLYSNYILAMRLVLRSELQLDSNLDAFITVDSYLAVSKATNALKRAPRVPRLINPVIKHGEPLYVFCDSSMVATGVMITSQDLVPIRAQARLISNDRASWTIVKKELLSVLEGVLLCFETLDILYNSWLPQGSKPVIYVFSDNEANCWRLRRALRRRRRHTTDPSTEGPASSSVPCNADPDLPVWERKTVDLIANKLGEYGPGEVLHIRGSQNPADVFSRGRECEKALHEDELLRSYVNSLTASASTPADNPVPLTVALDGDLSQPHPASPSSSASSAPSSVPSSSAPSSQAPPGGAPQGSLVDPRLIDEMIDRQVEDLQLKRILEDGKFESARERRLFCVQSVNGKPAVCHIPTGAVVVASHLQPRVLNDLHCLFGHVSYPKLYLAVTDFLYLGKYKDYRRTQLRCRTCLALKGSRALNHRAGKRKLLKAEKGWEVVGLDFVGPYKSFARSGDPRAMVLVAVDCFSNFVSCEVCPNGAPDTITLQGIQSLCYRTGFPLAFVADSDSRFRSRLVVSWLEALGVKLFNVVGNCHRYSGWQEIVHRSLWRVVRSLMLDDSYSKPWYQYMHRAAFILNNITRPTPDSSTFASMLHFCHGRLLPPRFSDRQPSESAREFAEGLSAPPIPADDREFEQYLYEHQLEASDLFQHVIAENVSRVLAARASLASQAATRRDLDNEFNVGDIVVRFNHNSLHYKLEPAWLIEDFYRISSLESGHVAVIEGKTKRRSKVVEVPPRRAMVYCITYLACGLLFNVVVYLLYGYDSEAAFGWFSGYVLEYMLSMDNVFFFQVVFKYYRTPKSQVNRALFYGIAMAAGLRLLFFFLGKHSPSSSLLMIAYYSTERSLGHCHQQLSGTTFFKLIFFTRYIFGLILIWSGYKTATGTDDQDSGDPNNACAQCIASRLRLFNAYSSDGAFFIKVPRDTFGPPPDCDQSQLIYDTNSTAATARLSPNSSSDASPHHQPLVYKATLLLMVVIVLGVVDVLFAVDSVTAKISQYDDMFINFSSSIFAMLTLRSLYFLVMYLSDLFVLMKYGKHLSPKFDPWPSRLVHVVEENGSPYVVGDSRQNRLGVGRN